MHDVSNLFTRQQVAQLASVSPSTIRRWARLGNCPAPIRYGVRSLRWSREEIDAWLRDPAAWRAAHEQSGVAA